MIGLDFNVFPGNLTFSFAQSFLSKNTTIIDLFSKTDIRLKYGECIYHKKKHFFKSGVR